MSCDDLFNAIAADLASLDASPSKMPVADDYLSVLLGKTPSTVAEPVPCDDALRTSADWETFWHNSSSVAPENDIVASWKQQPFENTAVAPGAEVDDKPRAAADKNTKMLWPNSESDESEVDVIQNALNALGELFPADLAEAEPSAVAVASSPCPLPGMTIGDSSSSLASHHSDAGGFEVIELSAGTIASLTARAAMPSRPLPPLAVLRKAAPPPPRKRRVVYASDSESDSDDDDYVDSVSSDDDNNNSAPAASVTHKSKVRKMTRATATATTTTTRTTTAAANSRSQKDRENYHALCGLTFHASPLRFSHAPTDDGNFNNYVCVNDSGEPYVTPLLRACTFSIVTDKCGRRLVFAKQRQPGADYVYIGQEGHPLTGLCITSGGPEFDTAAQSAQSCGATCQCDSFVCKCMRLAMFCVHDKCSSGAECRNRSLAVLMPFLRSSEMYYALSRRKANKRPAANKKDAVPAGQRALLPPCPVPTVPMRVSVSPAQGAAARAAAASGDLAEIKRVITLLQMKPR